MPPKLEYLLSLTTRSPGGRIICSKDLSEVQIADADLHNRFYVDADGLGYAFVPWSCTTKTDREREANYFSRNGMMV